MGFLVWRVLVVSSLGVARPIISESIGGGAADSANQAC